MKDSIYIYEMRCVPNTSVNSKALIPLIYFVHSCPLLVIKLSSFQRFLLHQQNNKQKPRWWHPTALDSVSTTTHASYSQMGTLLLHFHFLFRISPENRHQWLWVPEGKTRKKIPIALFPNPMRSRVSSPKPCSLKRSLFYTYPRFVFVVSLSV